MLEKCETGENSKIAKNVLNILQFMLSAIASGDWTLIGVSSLHQWKQVYSNTSVFID